MKPKGCLAVDQTIRNRFWIECTAAQTPDREENVLLLIQIKAIRRAPLVEFQTDIQSEGHVNIFNLAKNAGTSVDQIERFYGKKRMRDPNMATEVTKVREQ
jgi:hypothetical protein